MAVDPSWKPVWATRAGWRAPDDMVFVEDAGGAMRGFKGCTLVTPRDTDLEIGDVIYVDSQLLGSTLSTPRHGAVTGVFEDKVWVKFYDGRYGIFDKGEVKKS